MMYVRTVDLWELTLPTECGGAYGIRYALGSMGFFTFLPLRRSLGTLQRTESV